MAVRRKKSLSTLSEVDLAYISGIWAGDGSIHARIIPREDYVLKFQIYLSANLTQKTKRKHILLQLQKILGVGIVRDRGDGMSDLTLNGFDLVGPFLTQLVPYMRLKKRQANIALKIIEQHPLVRRNPIKFLELCVLADQIAAANDSKNRTHASQSVLQKFKSLYPDIQFPDLDLTQAVKSPVA